MVLCALASANGIAAQQWNDERAIALVRQATDRRARQLADSGLVDYQATAHGYLTFLAQLGEGFREPPQVVKADELALQVYWRAPNLSKQRIVGRRDTTLLPTDIAYHRDHLGIVQNNFPAIIRLGDGDEVRDVPHPLSASGIEQYDFALSDSLRITMPGRVLDVYEVKVRPRDDRQARVIGAVYLDRAEGQVVRMALSFTRAAFKDRQLEDLFVVLENGLIGTQFWLPRRQEIEIRRTATWLDYPVRMIIRGRWEIGDYALNTGIPVSQFGGPEIVQAPDPVLRAHRFPSERILDSLPPDVRAVSAEEIRRVQSEVRELVREQALRRVRGSALAARGLSDFVRYNRVEGVALGAAWTWRLGEGASLRTRGRYGLQDDAAKGVVELGWQHARGIEVRVFFESDFRDVGDMEERSRLTNSIAAQEAGSDYTDPYGADAFGLTVQLPWGPVRWSLTGAQERHYALGIHATPATGSFRSPIAVQNGGDRVVLAAQLPTVLAPLGVEARGRFEARHFAKDLIATTTGCTACGPATHSLRASAVVELERPFGDARVVTRTLASFMTATDGVPVQEMAFFGGPISAPGYRYHELTGQGGISQRVELQVPVPFPTISLGRFGRSASRATLAPYVNGVLLEQVAATRSILGVPAPWNLADPLRPRPSGFYPSAGVGLLYFFDLMRFDVARGLRDGRWIFSMDLNRRFWSVL
jgi:hypothetical protein